MKCFDHPLADAVGSCKNCCRGLCPECAVEVKKALACRGRCEEQVACLQDLVERSRKMYASAGSGWKLQALGIVVLAAVFLVVGIRQSRMAFFLVPASLALFFSAGLTYYSGRRIARSAPDETAAPPKDESQS